MERISVDPIVDSLSMEPHRPRPGGRFLRLKAAGIRRAGSVRTMAREPAEQVELEPVAGLS